MDEQLRKRLEEAAENFRGYFLGRMNKCRKLKGKEPYSADNEVMDICLDAAELGYKEGAELGYKEAIAQAKEWMKENARHYSNTVIGRKAMIYDFEADMNKLWEEQK